MSVTRASDGAVRASHRAAESAAGLVLLGMALALHRDGLLGGPAFYERDTQLFYAPLAAWVGHQLQIGTYPLWLPDIFTGYPIYADGELGLLYLPQLLLLRLLPSPQAIVWLRVVHGFLAGLFTLGFLRTLRLDVLPALGGAVVFAFGSFLTAQMHHENVVRSAVWLPLVLSCAERALRAATGRRRAAWLALGALVYAQSAVGLHVQPVLMLALALVAYVGYRVVLGAAETGPAGARSASPGAAEPATSAQASGRSATAEAGRSATAEAGRSATAEAGRSATAEAGRSATAEAGRSATAEVARSGRPLAQRLAGGWRAAGLAVRAGAVGAGLAGQLARGRLGRVVLVAGGIGFGGLLIASAQWLPLAEWALVSFRRGGVDYEFASAFGLAPENLPTLLFPFFFRLPDGGTWWSLWQQWETELYVGVPTLALALVGIVGSHRREVLFFLPLGLVALLIGMAHYAPIVNLHLLLWSVPGFSFLRAPGRFTYLVVFALAGLAALGLQALADARAGPTGGRSRWSRRPRLVLALVGAAPCVGLLAALLALLPTWRASLLADPGRARATIETTYLAVRAQYPIDPDLVSRGLLASLDLANVKTAWSLVLLALTAGLFVVWLGLGTRRAALGQALFVTLMGLDLLVFASDFHPRAPLASLASAGLPGLARGERVLLDGPGSLPDLEPDQLVAAGVAAVEGYSSLPSQRHVELLAQTRAQPTLLDLWSARYVVEPTRPIDGRVAGGVTFRVEHPLAAGFGGSRPASFRLPPGLGPAAAVRLVGTLSYAFDVPQGTTVAELSLTSAGGTAASATASGEPGAAPANVPAATPAPAPASSRSVMLPIRAGVELAERAFDRPSLHGLLAHGRPAGRTALDFEEATPEGEAYQAHLYLAELPLTQPAQLSELTIMPILPKVLVEIHGLALVSASGEVRPLGLADREGLRLVGEDERHRLIEDQAALPRAFVVPRANGVSPGRHPELTPVQIVTSPDFDPRQDVLIEGDPTAGRPTAEQAAAEQPGRQPSAAERPRAAQPVAAQVEDLGPNAVRVRAAVDRPSYLVLDDFFHRGWTARVDGQPSRVFIANALFRAVAVEPGQHVVEFRFGPLSHVVGAIISAAALILALGVVVWGAVERRGNSVPSP